MTAPARFHWRWPILILTALVVWVYSRDDGNASDTDARNTFIAACRLGVKDRLKAPATASFSPVSYDTLQATGTGYRWAGTVDAQNSFGAEIRTVFTCEGQPDAPAVRLLD